VSERLRQFTRNDRLELVTVREAPGGRVPRRNLPFSTDVIIGIIAVLDTVAMLSGIGISSWVAWRTNHDHALLWQLTDIGFGVGVLFLLVATGSYDKSAIDNPIRQVTKLLLYSLVIGGTEAGLLVAMHLDSAFEWPLNGPINIVSVSVMIMCLTRIMMNSVLLTAARTGTISRNVAIVGAGDHGAMLLDSISQRKEPWTRIIGIFDDRLSRASDQIRSKDVLGTIDDLVHLSRLERIDEIVVALPWGAEKRLLQILDRLKVIPANVRLAPDAIGHRFLNQGFDKLDSVPVFNIFSRPISGWSALSKSIEDLVLGSLLLIAVSPIMLACAIAIRIDSPGPIFFKQKRYGYNNNLINVYKFRSMYVNQLDANAAKLATRDDPRITRVGRILRRTSLDEIPQLLNVVLGQMSLVGPRPHATQAKAAGKLYEEVVKEYAVRHKVKPGITGWAQVMGWRGETDTEDKIIRRVECDLYYMENWSILLDIEILFRTVLAVLGGSNAY
jgi:Undecaprenyl-phosphate glucose phosphotransferase